MTTFRRLALLPIAALVLAACQADDPGGSPDATNGGNGGDTADITNVVCVGEATTYLDWLNGDFEPDEPDAIEEADEAGDLLETIRERGTIIVSTDPNYAPQSFLEPDGTFVGFDIDVATEIADRLGVDIQFETPDWDLITAGNWGERWDISVGSMTITTPRKEILSFTRPYYFTPAALAASERSGVTSVDQLDFELPDGAEATTLPTDANCAEAIQAGREEFDLWVSAGPTVDDAIAREIPVVKVTDSIYVENLAVAIDKSGPEHAALLYEIDRIIGEMHEDGTLTELSEEWFDGEDLTQDPEG
ncbi:MAG TPA: transporter substrate-binding domain-containing protein [Candidatus Angelobacter sp.]|nr:transporter substrate-binding domain-containing protein [Candidatus Angelobacter sp.]